MKISIWALGHDKENYTDEGVSIFLNRLKHYCNIDLQVLNAKIKSTDVIAYKRLETEFLVSKLPKTDYSLILLDERGKGFNSLQFANFIATKQLESNKHLIFAIGGSYGFDEAFLKKYTSIKLSDMVLPHQMAKLFLIEQIYRAFTILKNENYHH